VVSLLRVGNTRRTVSTTKFAASSGICSRSVSSRTGSRSSPNANWLISERTKIRNGIRDISM